MFRYDSDSGSGNMSSFGFIQHWPPGPRQVACRLCNRIFLDGRALVHHLQSHMAEDGSISARQPEMKFRSHQRYGNDSSNQIQSNFLLPAPVQEFRPSIRNLYSPAQNPAIPARHYVSGAARFDVRPPRTPSVPAAMDIMIEQVGIDFIKPYIDQLDKPILDTVELVAIDDDEKKLELTLKL